MSKRRKVNGNSEPTIATSEPSEPLTIEKITKSPDELSTLVQVAGKDCYRVSKHVLGEVSWFKEFFSKEQDGLIYHLPDDHPAAVRILFLILHHRTDALPIFILQSELVDLASTCNRYDVSHIVVPHVEAKKWIENLWEDDEFGEKDWIAWIHILKCFYHVEERCKRLSTILDVVAGNMHMVEPDWVFKCNSRDYLVADINYSTQTVKDISLYLQDRRQRVWSTFRKSCLRLQNRNLQGDCSYDEIGRMSKFLFNLPEQVQPYISIVARLSTLKLEDVTELDSLVKERIKYLRSD